MAPGEPQEVAVAAARPTRPVADHRGPCLWGLLVALLVFAFGQLLLQLQQERLAQAAQLQLQLEAASIRVRLEADLNSNFAVALSLAALLAARPETSPADYERLMQGLQVWHPDVRSIGIAPDNILRYVYPLSGNERALGLNLEAVANQREALLRLRHTWQPVVSGPLALVQGGEGIILRVPVVRFSAAGYGHYWGQVDVLLAAAPTLEKAGLDANAGFRFALRGRDGKGAKGEVFWGEAALFAEATSQKMKISLPGGEWQLAVARRHEGLLFSWAEFLWQVLVLVLALGAGAVVAFAAKGQQRLQVLASHDSLTGLANRHQFLEQAEISLALAVRREAVLTLLNIDLEGFKCINDDFGHEVGDAMLVHVAERARECLRTTDLISRFGGDEFLVLLPDTGPGPVLEALLQRLREAVARPMVLKGNTLSVGISVGVACYPRDGFSLADLMRVSDFNMYADKRLRKNHHEAGWQAPG